MEVSEILQARNLHVACRTMGNSRIRRNGFSVNGRCIGARAFVYQRDKDLNS
jgi:hypothetical protein